MSSSTILDNLSKIKQLDSQNMIGSLKLLDQQVEQIAHEAENLSVPADYKDITNVVVLGMGGSTLGSHVLKSLFADKLMIPVEIVNGYHVPAYVSPKSLVIVSSYSGTTEEPVAALQEAQERKAKILIITSGGALEEAAQKERVPALIFSTVNNPCGSPRMGLGYSLVGQMLLFSKAGLLTFTSQDIQIFINSVQKYEKLYGVESQSEKNIAKQLATELQNFTVWYVGSEHLVGNAHVGANQMNENAKRFAGYFAIPELNHHLLEGLKFPPSNVTTLAFVFLNSKLYDKRVQTRYRVTKQLLDKHTIQHFSYDCSGSTPLEQVAETLVFTSYTSYYTALVEGIDPTAIPNVDFLKM
jgi:glucose/mannose-6-phosphate isomerase